MWFLDRLRLEHHRLEVEELAVVLDDVFGPEALADLDRLVQAAAARARVQPNGLPLVHEPPGSDTDFRATAGHDIQRCERARTNERVADAQQVHERPEAD